MKALTIDSIKARCVIDDGCLIWTGGMSGDKPTARHNGVTCNVRRLFWCLQHPSKALGETQVLRVTCDDRRCLTHLVRISRAELMRRTAVGMRGQSSVIAARTAARRRRSPLTHQMVHQIRQDTRPVDQIAAQHQVSRRTVQRIRKMEIWVPLAGSSVFRMGSTA